VALSTHAFPGNYAILAMSYSKVDEIEEANEYREKFNTTMRLDMFNEDELCISLALEVKNMFEANLKSSSP
jgi:hypothetical protein